MYIAGMHQYPHLRGTGRLLLVTDTSYWHGSHGNPQHSQYNVGKVDPQHWLARHPSHGSVSAKAYACQLSRLLMDSAIKLREFASDGCSAFSDAEGGGYRHSLVVVTCAGRLRNQASSARR